MHDRSNGLGGGFAGYGIYPEYKNQYAFHVFYDSNEAKEICERYLDRHLWKSKNVKKKKKLKESLSKFLYTIKHPKTFLFHKSPERVD